MILTSTHAIRTGNGETRSHHHPSGQMRSLCTTQRRDGADACSMKPKGHTVSLSYFECCARHGATRHGFGIPVAWSRYPWQPIQPQPMGAVPETSLNRAVVEAAAPKCEEGNVREVLPWPLVDLRLQPSDRRIWLGAGGASRRRCSSDWRKQRTPWLMGRQTRGGERGVE